MSNSEVYWIGDTHYGHKNIVRGVSEWSSTDGCRDFNTVEEMNETMIQNINNTVKWNDTLWHLGDWSFGGVANIEKFRHRIHCQNVHLILGNHDYPILKHIDKYAHLFSSIQQIKTKKICGQHIVMCHFPLFVWERHTKGSWNLAGHSHGNLKDPTYLKRKTLDVGLDNHPEFRPFHFDEIYTIMKSKSINPVDHH